MPTEHRVIYGITNKENKPLKLNFLINEESVFEIDELKSVDQKTITFFYDYTNTVNASLKIAFSGEEQQEKRFELHKIEIANQSLNKLACFYFPYQNDWWLNLDNQSKKYMTQKTISHGAVFGWFGDIEFDYQCHHNSKTTRSHSTLIGGLPHLGIKGIKI